MIDTATIDELTALHHDGKLSLARARRLADGETLPDDRARLLRIVGMCHLSSGDVRKARSAAVESRKLAESPLAQAEAGELRVAVAVNAANLDVAKAVCKGLTGRFLWHPEPEVRAITHFRLAYTEAYCGNLDAAERNWTASLETTNRQLYKVDSAHGLAKIYSEKGQREKSERFLGAVEPLTDRQRCFASLTRGLLLASSGEFLEAAASQREALGFGHSRSAVDRAMLAVPVVEYLARAGLAEEALAFARDLRRLVWQLEASRQEQAALVLLELAKATSTAGLVQASRTALIDLSGLASRQRDRSARRGRRKR